MCNANATGHRIGSKTSTEFRVQCRTAERVYGPVIVHRNRAGSVECPHCGDVFVVSSPRWSLIEDANGRIVEAN
jgi:uncharacterized Zn-finger protein